MSLRDWHIRNLVGVTAGVVAAVILVPIVLLIQIPLRVLGIGQTVDRTPGEMVRYLRSFIDDAEGELDWDDFESVPITDKGLDAIRQEALSVKLPVDSEGLSKLQELISRLAALAAERSGGPS